MYTLSFSHFAILVIAVLSTILSAHAAPIESEVRDITSSAPSTILSRALGSTACNTAVDSYVRAQGTFLRNANTVVDGINTGNRSDIQSNQFRLARNDVDTGLGRADNIINNAIQRNVNEALTPNTRAIQGGNVQAAQQIESGLLQAQRGVESLQRQAQPLKIKQDNQLTPEFNAILGAGFSVIINCYSG